jgi:hypothetical protein
LRLLSLLFVRERPQAANEENKLPTVAVLRLVRIAPSGHPCELDTIFNDVMNVAVGEALGLRGSQVRDARIERLAYRRESAAIVTVARLATSREGVAAILKILLRGFEWILFVSRATWDRKISRSASYGRFKAGRLACGAKTAMNPDSSPNRCKDHKQNQRQQKSLQEFHVRSLSADRVTSILKMLPERMVKVHIGVHEVS